MNSNNLITSLNIVSNGSNNIKSTEEYKSQVLQIKEKITSKYDELKQKESSFIKRIILYIRMKYEMRVEIQKLTSRIKLYISKDN